MYHFIRISCRQGTLAPGRLTEGKGCRERSDGGEGGGAIAHKKEKPSSCVGRKTKAYKKGELGSVPLQ